MKLVIETKASHADNNIHTRGVQLLGQFVNQPGDTAEDHKILSRAFDVLRADLKDEGIFLGIGAIGERFSHNRRHEREEGRAPLSPREIAIKARLNSAEQLAASYKRTLDAVRIAVTRHGLWGEVGEILAGETANI